jgi:hypothetical protein
MSVLRAAVLGGCAVALPSCAVAGRPAADTFQCADGRTFAVARTPRSAIVELGQDRLELSRRRSSIGEKYSSKTATLIIDGDFAVLVTRQLNDLRACYKSNAA